MGKRVIILQTHTQIGQHKVEIIGDFLQVNSKKSDKRGEWCSGTFNMFVQV